MNRTIACFPNSYGRFGVEAAVPLMQDIGLRHIELPIKNAGVPSFFGEQPILTDASGPDDLDRVRSLLAEHDMAISCCNITAGNPLDPKVVDATCRKLDLVADLGVPLVVAGAGEAESDADRATLYRHLGRIGDYAGERGITYCFETHPGICQNADGMLETMRVLDHPHLRINFDTGNILYYNDGADVLASLESVIDYVRHVHLKDSPGGYRDWTFTTLGTGIVDFRRLREILDKAGFTGPYSLEIEGIEGEEPLTLEQHHQRVADSVTYLRSLGYFDAI